MCMSCGCGEPREQHGDPRNLTLKHVQDAADAAGISRDQVVQNMQDACKQLDGKAK